MARNVVGTKPHRQNGSRLKDVSETKAIIAITIGERQMASILTNTSAMTALQNLRSINSNLVDTQSQIATGKKIANARDNATV